ncbi:hypothetical protein CR969_01285 [Candidatus Saccharibacteria bacterium]|nr:MAG: hypothetical protein CR969_01285 [Candidatus Saccharibacteria bacterium]
MLSEMIKIKKIGKMKLYQQIIAPLTVLISLTTACGVLLHDTNSDKALMSAITAKHDFKAGSDSHTHAERVSLSETIRESNANPRTTPRDNERKHSSNKQAARPFDGHDTLHSLVLKGVRL